MLNRKPNRSFTKRITQWMMILAVVSMLLFGFFVLLFVNESTKNSMRLRIYETSNTMLGFLESRIETYDAKLTELSKDKSFLKIVAQKNITSDDKNFVLYRMFDILQADANVVAMHFVANTASKSISTQQVPPMYELSEFSDWGVLRFAKHRKDHALFANRYIWPNRKKNSFTITCPVYTGKNLLGYLIVDFTESFVKKVSNTLDTGYLGNVQFILTSADDFIIYNSSDCAKKQIKINTALYSVNDQFANTDYTVGLVKNDTLHVILLGLVHNNFIKSNFQLLTKVLLFTLIPSLLLAFSIAYMLSKSIVTPILKLAAKVKNLDSKETAFEIDNEDELNVIEYAFQELLNRMNQYHQIDIEKREQLRIAEVKALQSQINPHFLYNTLDSIKWQAKLSGVNDIARMATELGKVLKASMNFNETLIPLKNEIELIHSYIYIQKQRYSDRFQFNMHIDKLMLDFMIPKFILQPLVENAIVHGMENKSEFGVITVNGYMDEKHMIFEVIDNGQGFQQDFQSIMQDEKHGIGLKNVDKRIKLYYGLEYGVTLDLNYQQGTKLIVKILKESGGNVFV